VVQQACMIQGASGAQFISSNCNFCSACFTDVPRYMRRRVTMTACDREGNTSMMSTIGKDTSPYGKATSSSFKFLSSEDGLCRAGRCDRLVFGFVAVFWEYRGLNRAVRLSKEKNTNTRTMACFLTAIEARPRTGPLEGSGKR
jgi:hypothetical protein